MARSSNTAAAARPIGLWAIIGCAAALVLFVGYVAYSNFVAPPRTVPMSKEAKVKNDRLTDLAKQSGGDITKLSEEDRAWVNGTTGGFGAMVLRQMASRK